MLQVWAGHDNSNHAFLLTVYVNFIMNSSGGNENLIILKFLECIQKKMVLYQVEEVINDTFYAINQK